MSLPQLASHANSEELHLELEFRFYYFLDILIKRLSPKFDEIAKSRNQK